MRRYEPRGRPAAPKDVLPPARPRVRVSMGVVCCLCGVVEGASPLDKGLGRALCRGLFGCARAVARGRPRRPFGAGRAAARRRQVSAPNARAKTRAKVLERQPKAPAPGLLQKRKPPPPKPQEVVVWPPSQVPERTGTIAACDLAPTSLQSDAAGPSEQRRAKALAELLKRAAGPGGGLDAREADADRVLRELRPLVGDARASLRAPACDCAAAWLDRVRNRDDARKLAAKTGLVVEAAAAVARVR